MTMKKIMAGVLAVASVLSVSATAFAAPEAPAQTKEITKPAETEYEAGVGMMGAELSVELPASMTAFLNPYSAEVDVDAETTPTKSKEGIVSWAYEVVNNTADFGIMIDVKHAKATPAATVAIDAPGTAEAANVKTAALVLQAGDTAADATTYDKTITATAQATATKQGTFVFGTTEASRSKIAYAAPKGKVYLGLTGAISKVNATGEDLEWTDEDTIAAAYTLKINPSAKTQADAFNGAGGGPVADPIDTAMTAITFTSDGTAPTGDAFAAGTTAYTLTGGSAGDELTFTGTATTGYTVSYSSTNGNGQNKTDGTLILKSGTNTMTVTVTDDTDGAKTKAYTYTITLP